MTWKLTCSKDENSNIYLERLQKCNTACICSVRVSGRVALRGICGRVRVAEWAYI
jgi:hypothetical protein